MTLRRRNPQKEKPAAAKTDTRGYWAFTDHVCRECLGRILVRLDGATAGAHRCSNCGVEQPGAIEDICACGLTMKDGKRDMRLRCTRNPKQRADFPAEVVVKRIPLSAIEFWRPAGQPALPLRFYKPARVPD